jgi:hypothetical protein
MIKLVKTAHNYLDKTRELDFLAPLALRLYLLKFPENFSPNFPADISDKKPI